MNLSAPLKVLALVVFLAAVAGATYGVQQYLGDGVEARLVTATTPRDTLNATPGHSVTYAVTLVNRGDDVRNVTALLAGPAGEIRSEPRRLEGGASHTVLMTVPVPAGLAEGVHPLTLTLLGDAGDVLRTSDGMLKLRVLPPGPGFAQGDSANVLYTGRLAATGEVFNTNDPALQPLTFSRTGGYRFSPGLLDVRSLPQPSVVAGFFEGVLGMQPGESRTVTFGPEKGYGNATTEERMPRTREIERRETLDLPEAPLANDAFAEYLSSTQQGVPEDYDVGEFVRSERNGETLRYRVVEKTAEGVTLRLHVETGERYTIFEFWRNGSVVESVTETTATFYTTPTTPEGEAFTFFPHWPDMSRVASMNETAIVVRHDPPEGLKYTQAGGQFAPPRSYTVVSLTENEIVVSTPATSPLAGQALTFDILLVDVRRAG